MQNFLKLIEKLTKGIGSLTSVLIHTLIFGFILLIGCLRVADWDTVLLVLTTAVSLEAIYLAIFIQMSVNQNTQSLKAVEEDVDEIQKDIDEIQEDVDVIQENVDEIQEDASEEEQRDAQHQLALENISKRLHQLLSDFDNIKKP